MKKLLLFVLVLAMLPLSALAGQEIVPNGIQRIGATGQHLDYDSVGVAVIDTGIDPDITDLNVVGGVDCTEASGAYLAKRAVMPGAQRSIWDADPDAKERAEAAKKSTSSTYQPGTTPPMENGVPVIGPDGIFSLYGMEFNIETVGANPSTMGGANPKAEGYEDGNGHGTHVSGIIGAKQDGQGLVGVAPDARLYSVRVLDNGGSGSLDNVICGLDWVAANAADEGISVANMSLGMDTGQKVMDMVEACDTDEDNLPNFVVKTGKLRDEFHEAICDVVDAGVVVVVAAGNGWGDSATTIPAAYPEVITVSNFYDGDGLPGGLAPDEANACPQYGGNDDQLWSHLNGSPSFGYGSYGGEAVDFSAPGTCVLSTFPGGMQSLTGTSMASPHVAGAVARLVGDANGFDGAITSPEQGRLRVDTFRHRLVDIAEAQTPAFRDNDEWHEPIVHVASGQLRKQTPSSSWSALIASWGK